MCAGSEVIFFRGAMVGEGRRGTAVPSLTLCVANMASDKVLDLTAEGGGSPLWELKGTH